MPKWAIKLLAIWLGILGAGTGIFYRGASRSLSVMGATSLVPYVKSRVSLWERFHPTEQVVVAGGGSIAGLIGVSRGRVDIGMSDIRPPSGLVSQPLESVPVGRMPILFIVNPKAGVKGLSLSQLQAVLTGRVTNWAGVGGSNLPIVVVTRPSASGSRAVVEADVILHRRFSPMALVQLSNGAVVRTVEDTPGAIGFVEAGFRKPGVVSLAVAGHRFDVRTAKHWPFNAYPRLYLRASRLGRVWRLAKFLGNPQNAWRYGIYPEETER